MDCDFEHINTSFGSATELNSAIDSRYWDIGMLETPWHKRNNGVNITRGSYQIGPSLKCWSSCVIIITRINYT